MACFYDVEVAHELSVHVDLRERLPLDELCETLLHLRVCHQVESLVLTLIVAHYCHETLACLAYWEPLSTVHKNLHAHAYGRLTITGN